MFYVLPKDKNKKFERQNKVFAMQMPMPIPIFPNGPAKLH